jgi:hypothetical protein
VRAYPLQLRSAQEGGGTSFSGKRLCAPLGGDDDLLFGGRQRRCNPAE